MVGEHARGERHRHDDDANLHLDNGHELGVEAGPGIVSVAGLNCAVVEADSGADASAAGRVRLAFEGSAMWREHVYCKPVANTTIAPIYFLLDNCSFHIATIGSRRSTTSITNPTHVKGMAKTLDLANVFPITRVNHVSSGLGIPKTSMATVDAP